MILSIYYLKILLTCIKWTWKILESVSLLRGCCQSTSCIIHNCERLGSFAKVLLNIDKIMLLYTFLQESKYNTNQRLSRTFSHCCSVGLRSGLIKNGLIFIEQGWRFCTPQNFMALAICYEFVLQFHITSHLLSLWWTSGGGVTNSLSHVLYMGVSYSC